MKKSIIAEKVCETLIRASSTFSDNKKQCYKECIMHESNADSEWAMQMILENAETAENRLSPLCDDTGIPHIILEIGENRSLTGEIIESVYEGIRQGLDKLPGRPMAIMGNDMQRIDQSGGLDPESSKVMPAPFLLKYSDDPDTLRLTVMMQGGGPEIRSKTYRVFHKHSINVVMNEIASWASEVVGQLGCSPCTIAVGIGRSHFEAASLMLQAMAEGDYSVQSDWEKFITAEVNKKNVGALGLGGDHSALATFLKIGPQRASGVRIVCMRPGCCFEPRKASVDL